MVDLLLAAVGSRRERFDGPREPTKSYTELWRHRRTGLGSVKLSRRHAEFRRAGMTWFTETTHPTYRSRSTAWIYETSGRLTAASVLDRRFSSLIRSWIHCQPDETLSLGHSRRRFGLRAQQGAFALCEYEDWFRAGQG